MKGLEQVKEKAAGNGTKEVLVWVEKKQVCNDMQFLALRVKCSYVRMTEIIK